MSTQVAPRHTEKKRRLIDGCSMRCPRCKTLHDVLKYIPMKLIEEFADETAVIYKCPKCRWIFAPIEDIVVRIKERQTETEVAPT